MAKETLLQTMWMGFGDDRILRIRILEGVTIDLKQAKLMNECMIRLAETDRFPVLIDARASYNWDKDAQEYSATHSDFRLATAVITNNPLSKLLTNTYVKIFKPPYPVQLFSNEEKAVSWLQEFL